MYTYEWRELLPELFGQDEPGDGGDGPADGDMCIRDSDSELWMGEIIPGPGFMQDDGEDSQQMPMKIESDGEDDVKPLQNVQAEPAVPAPRGFILVSFLGVQRHDMYG